MKGESTARRLNEPPRCYNELIRMSATNKAAVFGVVGFCFLLSFVAPAYGESESECVAYKRNYDEAIAQKKTPPAPAICDEATPVGPVRGHCVVGTSVCKGEKTAEGKDPSRPDVQVDTSKNSPTNNPDSLTPPFSPAGLEPKQTPPPIDWRNSVLQGGILNSALNPPTASEDVWQSPSADSFNDMIKQQLQSDSGAPSQNSDTGLGATLQRWGASVFGDGNSQTMTPVDASGQSFGDPVQVQTFNPSEGTPGSTFAQPEASETQTTQPSGCDSWWCPYTQAAQKGLKAVGDAIFPSAEAKPGPIRCADSTACGSTQSGVASWYNCGTGGDSGPCIGTRNNPISPRDLSMASGYPVNTVVEVCTASGKCIHVVSNDDGGFRGNRNYSGGNRIADLSPAAFERLAPLDQGVIKGMTLNPVAKFPDYRSALDYANSLNQIPVPQGNPLRAAESAINASASSFYSDYDLPSGQSVTQQFLDASSQQIQSNVLAYANETFTAAQANPDFSTSGDTGIAVDTSSGGTGNQASAPDNFVPNQNPDFSTSGDTGIAAVTSDSLLSRPVTARTRSLVDFNAYSPASSASNDPFATSDELESIAESNQLNRDRVAAETPSWLQAANEFVNDPGRAIADAAQSFVQESRSILDNFQSNFNLANAPGDTVGSALDGQNTDLENSLAAQERIRNASNDSVGGALDQQEYAASLYDQAQRFASDPFLTDAEFSDLQEQRLQQDIKDAYDARLVLADEQEKVSNDLADTEKAGGISPFTGPEPIELATEKPTPKVNPLEGLILSKSELTPTQIIEANKRRLGDAFDDIEVQGAFVDQYRAQVITAAKDRIDATQQKLDELPLPADQTLEQAQEHKNLKASIDNDEALIARQTEILKAPFAKMTTEQLQDQVNNYKSVVNGHSRDTPGIVAGAYARLDMLQDMVDTRNRDVIASIDATAAQGRLDNPVFSHGGPIGTVEFLHAEQTISEMVAQGRLDSNSSLLTPVTYTPWLDRLEDAPPVDFSKLQLIGAREPQGDLSSATPGAIPSAEVIVSDAKPLSGPDARPPLSSDFETFEFKPTNVKPTPFADATQQYFERTGSSLPPAGSEPLTPEQAAGLNPTEISGKLPDTQKTTTVTPQQDPNVTLAEQRVSNLAGKIEHLQTLLNRNEQNPETLAAAKAAVRAALASAERTTPGLEGTGSNMGDIAQADRELKGLSQALDNSNLSKGQIQAKLNDARVAIRDWDQALPDRPAPYKVTTTIPGAAFSHSIPPMTAGEGVTFADAYSQYQNALTPNNSVPTAHWEPQYAAEIDTQFPSQTPNQTPSVASNDAPPLFNGDGRPVSYTDATQRYFSATGEPLTAEQAERLNETTVTSRQPDTVKTTTTTEPKSPAVIAAENAVDNLAGRVNNMKNVLEGALNTGKLDWKAGVGSINAAQKALAQANATIAGLEGTDSDLSDIRAASTRLNKMSSDLNQLKDALGTYPTDMVVGGMQGKASEMKGMLNSTVSQVSLWSNALPDEPTPKTITTTIPGATFTHNIPAIAAAEPFAYPEAAAQYAQYSNTQFASNWEPQPVVANETEVQQTFDRIFVDPQEYAQVQPSGGINYSGDPEQTSVATQTPAPGSQSLSDEPSLGRVLDENNPPIVDRQPTNAEISAGVPMPETVNKQEEVIRKLLSEQSTALQNMSATLSDDAVARGMSACASAPSGRTCRTYQTYAVAVQTEQAKYDVISRNYDALLAYKNGGELSPDLTQSLATMAKGQGPTSAAFDAYAKPYLEAAGGWWEPISEAYKKGEWGDLALESWRTVPAAGNLLWGGLTKEAKIAAEEFAPDSFGFNPTVDEAARCGAVGQGTCTLEAVGHGANVIGAAWVVKDIAQLTPKLLTLPGRVSESVFTRAGSELTDLAAGTAPRVAVETQLPGGVRMQQWADDFDVPRNVANDNIPLIDAQAARLTPGTAGAEADGIAAGTSQQVPRGNTTQVFQNPGDDIARVANDNAVLPRAAEPPPLPRTEPAPGTIADVVPEVPTTPVAETTWWESTRDFFGFGKKEPKTTPIVEEIIPFGEVPEGVRPVVRDFELPRTSEVTPSPLPRTEPAPRTETLADVVDSGIPGPAPRFDLNPVLTAEPAAAEAAVPKPSWVGSVGRWAWDHPKTTLGGLGVLAAKPTVDAIVANSGDVPPPSATVTPSSGAGKPVPTAAAPGEDTTSGPPTGAGSPPPAGGVVPPKDGTVVSPPGGVKPPVVPRVTHEGADAVDPPPYKPPVIEPDPRRPGGAQQVPDNSNPSVPSPTNQQGSGGQGGGIGGFFSGLMSALSNLFGGSQSSQPTPTTPATKPPVTTPPAATSTVAKPFATLIANPPTILSGKKSRLMWSSINTSSCELFATNNLSLAKGIRGSTSTSALTATTIFRLDCSASSGATTSSRATVTVQ